MKRANAQPPIGPALARLLDEADIKWVDIGARGGSFGPMRPLAPFAQLFAVEPEPREAERLRALLMEEGWRGVHPVQRALGRAGRRQLHVTRQPGLTSLLPPDPRTVSRYFAPDDWEVVETLDVEVVSLAAAAAEYKFEDACFLKADTQGTELEILESGGKVLRNLVGVYIELEFQPFYRGQPLFGEVDAFLRAHDLFLAQMETVSTRVFPQTAAYSARHPVWAHALYLREPASLAGPDAPQLAARWLAVALCLDEFDVVLAQIPHLPFAPQADRSELERDVRAWAAWRAKQMLHPVRVLVDGIHYVRSGRRRWTDPTRSS